MQGGDPNRTPIQHDSKRSLRRLFRRRRREHQATATPGLRSVAGRELPAMLPPQTWLGLYWPVGSEPDLDPWAPDGLVAALASQAGLSVPGAVRLALPAVLPPRPGEALGRLIYLPWERETPLRPDACGVPAPLPADDAELRSLPPEALGLLLVPALAVDRAGVRLGSGGGWYDRLRAEPTWRAVAALAVLPSACVVDRLPRDPWDMPFSGWLDESGIWAAEATEAAEPRSHT